MFALGFAVSLVLLPVWNALWRLWRDFVEAWAIVRARRRERVREVRGTRHETQGERMKRLERERR